MSNGRVLQNLLLSFLSQTHPSENAEIVSFSEALIKTVFPSDDYFKSYANNSIYQKRPVGHFRGLFVL